MVKINWEKIYYCVRVFLGAVGFTCLAITMYKHDLIKLNNVMFIMVYIVGVITITNWLWTQADKFNKIRKVTKIQLPFTDGFVSANSDYITADFYPFSPCDNKIIEKAKKDIADLQFHNDDASPEVIALVKNLQELIERVEDWQYSSLVKTKHGVYRYIFKNPEQVKVFLDKYTPKN